MATKKRPAPKTKPKTKPKPKAKPRAPKRPLAVEPVAAPAPLVQVQESHRGLWVLLVAVALIGLFLWKAGHKAPQATAPAAVPAAKPEGRSPSARAEAPALPAFKAENEPRMGKPHRASAGAPAAAPAEPDGASQTFDPSQGSLALRCWRPAGGSASLEVFGARNAKLRTLSSEAGEAGWKVLQWDGKDEAGKRVPAGLYFLRLSAKDGQEVRDLWVKG